MPLTPEQLAAMFAEHTGLTEEQQAAIVAVKVRELGLQEEWRRIVTGPWAMLFCECEDSDMFRWKPSSQPLTAGCAVHGQFMMTPDGRVL
jgi:hypothetical protein